MSEVRSDFPALPELALEVLDDRTDVAADGFLRLRRLRLRNRWADGDASEPYRYDVLERDAVDAVCVVLWADGPEQPSVCLRSSLRPPLALRPGYRLPIPEPVAEPYLWELPAGLIEPGETGETGLRACASRETLEETGLTVAPDEFTPLGTPFFLSPGVVAEKIHLFHARVDPASAGEPQTDGHPVEARAAVVFVPLSVAIAGAAAGHVRDVKTELGLRRFREAR